MAPISARRFISACVLSVAASAALVAPGAASAATQCSGSNIVGAGASFQKLAQETWGPAFNTSKNPKACSGTQGSKGIPTHGYESVGSGAGLERWGYKGHAFEAGGTAIVSTDEAPNPAIKAEMEANETTLTPETVQSVPIVQGSVAIVMNLPANCVATSTAVPGRLVLNNVTLESIWRGTITKWSEIKDSGDALSGAGCNPETTITRVVRLDGSGTTHILKAYLALINATSFETEKAETKTWKELDEGPENTTWPKLASVVKPVKTGGGAVAAKVAETPSSIGYVALSDARNNGGFSKTGGPGTGKFWAEIQNSGTSTKKLTYADPASNGDAEAVANANCEKEKFTNGLGTKFPPKTTAEDWSQVTTATKQKNYTLCGITYALVLKGYSKYPGTTEGEAITAHDFLLWVLETKAEGGQPTINNHDYLPLPKSLVKEATAGAALAAF
jgi:ABC-type phosphate transport system substrate-binding protein